MGQGQYKLGQNDQLVLGYLLIYHMMGYDKNSFGRKKKSQILFFKS